MWPPHDIRKFSAVFAAFLLALAFRLPQLGDRPLHGDEANQAMKTGVLLETGRYAYDPHEHHGPTLYYGTLPLLWVFGAHDSEHAREWMFRLLPALFGAGTVLVVLLVPGLGALEAGLAALFIAVSHAMVFYSRYYVQESLLVFFAFLALIALQRLLLRPTWVWAIVGGVAVGLAHATKETSVILFFAMAIALAAPLYLQRSGLVLRRSIPFLAVAGLLAIMVSVLFFSSFFTHWRGPLDSVLTYANYLGRAQGQGSVALHDKPWWWYFSVLGYTYREAGPIWTEAFGVALAVLGGAIAIGQKGLVSVDRRFALPGWAIYTLVVTGIFCLIPYKTPWNLLPFWQPALVPAGVGAAWLVQKPRHRWLRVAMALLLVAGFAHAARQSWQGNFVYAADTRNPYVYAHTSTALLRLTQRLDDLAKVAPNGKEMHINILKPDADYWPLPWYLRTYTKVGYWTQPPKDIDADVIIADAKLGQYVDSHKKAEYQFEFHALRPGVNLLVYIRKPLWEAYMAGRR